ncbi:MAG: hypothetical protein IAE79_24380 [Anaerolinea sp.]|nr:hypothetical protein [Anaerolinea sp.]
MSKTRLPFLFLAILALLAALWAGLLRIGWQWPSWQPTLPAAHGPLMISGFLGTLIALERAVALNKRWAYVPALVSGVGGLVLLTGLSWSWGNRLLTVGSLGLLILFGFMIRQHLTIYTLVMAAGALSWFIGNALQWSGWPIYRVTLWWLAFLILTIAGERLELDRVLRLSRRVQGLFVGATAVFSSGVLLSLHAYGLGMRVSGVGMILLAAWLLTYDIARRNLRQIGLTRFIAVALFSGYVWLGMGGWLALWYGGVAAGPIYDAILHAIFLGFVFAMIFGHAPIIFPAILNRPMPYSPRFYSHLLALHLSLMLRVGGDLLAWPAGRQWGGLLNALTLLLFLGNTILALRQNDER